MKLKIEIVADDALGQFEELRKIAETSLEGGKSAFKNLMEETWKKQLLGVGLKPISVKVSVLEDAKGVER